MLRALFRREELEAKPAPPTGDPNYCPKLLPQTLVPNRCTEPLYPTDVPNRRHRRIKVGRLYPERASEALVHARALLRFISNECPELAGNFVPQSDLEKTYLELCRNERWNPRHWTAIGRQLGTLTARKAVKRNGRRFTAYRLPRT